MLCCCRRRSDLLIDDKKFDSFDHSLKFMILYQIGVTEVRRFDDDPSMTNDESLAVSPVASYI